jgi:hypothetical protein
VSEIKIASSAGQFAISYVNKDMMFLPKRNHLGHSKVNGTLLELHPAFPQFPFFPRRPFGKALVVVDVPADDLTGLGGTKSITGRDGGYPVDILIRRRIYDAIPRCAVRVTDRLWCAVLPGSLESSGPTNGRYQLSCIEIGNALKASKWEGAAAAQ